MFINRYLFGRVWNKYFLKDLKVVKISKIVFCVLLYRRVKIIGRGVLLFIWELRVNSYGFFFNLECLMN